MEAQITPTKGSNQWVLADDFLQIVVCETQKAFQARGRPPGKQGHFKRRPRPLRQTSRRKSTGHQLH
jgi:hypothetical protein